MKLVADIEPNVGSKNPIDRIDGLLDYLICLRGRSSKYTAAMIKTTDRHTSMLPVRYESREPKLAAVNLLDSVICGSHFSYPKDKNRAAGCQMRPGEFLQIVPEAFPPKAGRTDWGAGSEWARM